MALIVDPRKRMHLHEVGWRLESFWSLHPLAMTCIEARFVVPGILRQQLENFASGGQT